VVVFPFLSVSEFILDTFLIYFYFLYLSLHLSVTVSFFLYLLFLRPLVYLFVVGLKACERLCICAPVCYLQRSQYCLAREEASGAGERAYFVTCSGKDWEGEAGNEILYF
jgi:hypothetical protein